MGDLEREFVGAMREIEREKLMDPWGNHASHLAHGIEKSGVPAMLGDLQSATHAQTAEISQGFSVVEERLGSVEAATRGVRDAVMALAAVNAAGFASICQQLGETNNLLGDIENILANPLSTSAAERYRRGVHALTQGWPDLALDELDAAIEQDPFQAISHFSRGLALGALAREDEASTAFVEAIRFTGKDRNLDPVAAGAAVLAAQAYERRGNTSKAIQVAEEALSKVGDSYAELLFTLGRLKNDPAILRRAITLAPEIAAVAVAVDIPNARSVANEVYAAEDGPIQPMIRAATIARSLGHPVTIPSSPPEVMTFHRAWIHGVSQQLARRAEAEMARADVDRQTAESSAQQATRVLGQKKSSNAEAVSTGIPAVIALFLGGFVFKTGLVWLEYFKDDETDKPGRALLSLLALPLGGVVLLFGVWMVFITVGELAKARRAAVAGQNAKTAAVMQAESNTQAAAIQSERAAQAAIVLELIEMSTPKRSQTMLAPD